MAMNLYGLRWLTVVALIVVFVGAACSGAPAPTSAQDEGSPSGQIADLNSGKSAAGGKNKGASTKVKGSRISKKGAAGGAADAPATSVAASGTAVSTKAQVKRSERLERRLPDVNLWPKSTDRMGFHDDKIVLCGHAALTFADVFDTRPQDLNVYWEWVNDHGGIFGRKVELSIEDDGYRPDRAVEASERCKAKEPFMLLGGIGFDQIPAVRAWNEQKQNHLLYIHHIARADLAKRYSFSFFPTVEQAGTFAARWMLQKHGNERIGAVWRQSESWQPGHKTWLATMKKNGKEPVADLPVQKDQAVYTQQIAELKAQEATTVFVWENALAATEIVKQAKNQDYHPTWVVFPFQLTTDTLGNDALQPPMEGIAFWHAYVPGMTSGPFSSYAAEIKRFEAAQRKYGAANKGNDILWMTWLAWKQLHQLLLDCGPDCSRNEAVALMISGVHKAVAPNCPFDFTRNQHVGGLFGNIFKAFRPPSGGAGWMGTRVCARI